MSTLRALLKGLAIGFGFALVGLGLLPFLVLRSYLAEQREWQKENGPFS